MAGHRALQSPVLVGREDFLALADRRLAEVDAGRGHLLFVAGEAGIGKTRLLAAITGAAVGRAFAVVRAAAFPGDTEASGGLLLDLASDLRQAGDAGLREVGDAMSTRLRAFAGVGGDRHRQRRLLVQDLTDAFGRLGAEGAVLVVLEDLHWTDQLSLEVVGHLATRLADRPMLVAGAYRSDELYPRLPMREWRARLLTQRLAEEIRLPRLSVAQTATMTGALLGHAPSARIVAAVHDRSDGIPLHVEELLSAVTVPDPGGIPAVPVPDTLADAVLARTRALDEPSRGVAYAGAVIGRSFEFDLLTAVSQLAPALVDHGLRRLQELYLVQPGADPVTFDFRHALIRDVLYGDIPVPERRRLHRRVASAAAERGYRDAFVSAHFDQAGLAEPAYRHAVAAAGEAVALSAHREALELYRRAQRNLPARPAPRDHAALLTAIGGEAAASDENSAALEAYEQAHRLLTGIGDHLAHVQWARGRWELADQTAEHALADGRGGITTRITAEHVLGYLAMGRGDWERAAELLGEALELGEAMAELQRVSPALWGLAETALLRGDHQEATALCDRRHAASASVGDAAYLFPFLLTGVRARLAGAGAGDAGRWLAEVAGALTTRSIPGTLVAVDHGQGLLQLADGDLAAARATLERAATGWRERHRFWEGTWALLDQARCAVKARRRAEASALAREARALAVRATAHTIVAEADRLLAAAAGHRPPEPWSPLTAREFEVARLVAAGHTNREIASRLFLSPKTVGAHVEHILTKLGAARRAEIAAWVTAMARNAEPDADRR